MKTLIAALFILGFGYTVRLHNRIAALNAEAEMCWDSR